MARGIEPQGRQYIASMGIYIFNRPALVEALTDELNIDFGRDIIPKRGFFKTARLGVEDTLTLFSRQTLPIDGKGTVKG